MSDTKIKSNSCVSPCKDKMFFNSIVYVTDYGTPQRLSTGLPSTILNIKDASKRLSEMMLKLHIKKTDAFYEGPHFSSVGEVHVYSDGSPMRFVKAKA